MWKRVVEEKNNSIPKAQKINIKNECFTLSPLKQREGGRFREIAEPDACKRESTESQNEFTRVPYPQLFGTITHSVLS